MTSVVSRLPLLVAWFLIAAISVSLAYWTWRLLPLPTAAGPVRHALTEQLGDEALKAQNWFAGSAGSKPASSGRYTLRWLYPGRPGVCILGMAGLQDQTFRIGDEIEPGVKLKEVGKDYVLIQGQRGAERIDFPEHNEIPQAVSVTVVAPVNRIEPDVENR